MIRYFKVSTQREGPGGIMGLSEIANTFCEKVMSREELKDEGSNSH